MKYLPNLLLLLVAGFCTATPQALNNTRPDSLFTLIGQVTDELGQGLPDANLHIENTDHAGLIDPYGSFRLLNIPEGRVVVTIRCRNYTPLRETLNFSNPPNTIRTFHRERDFVLRYAHCPDDSTRAAKDIRDRSISFPLGSFVPAPLTREDSVFEREYGIHYYDVGCIVEPEQCMLIYYRVTFQYLDEHFGPGWRNRVNPELEQWTATIPYRQ